MLQWFVPRVPIFAVFLTLVLGAFLAQEKARGYEGNWSSLIGIWTGFEGTNPDLVDTGFVVLEESGYDGQFFYLVAKSLFQGSLSDLVVDSTYFRLHRIGLPLLSGSLSFLFGWQSYPEHTLYLLWFFHALAFLVLYESIPKKASLSFFFLLSPFSWNASLLLVADGLFTSFCLLGYLFWFRKQYFWAILFLGFAVFTRELGLLFLLPFLILSFQEKAYARLLLLFFLGFSFIAFVWVLPIVSSQSSLGTNPLGFFEMIDFPFFGFFKSFWNQGSFQISLKEGIRIFLFLGFLLLLSFALRNISGSGILSAKESLALWPILFSLGVILIAEQGYWRSFDNLSRMFALSLPFVVLLEEKKQTVFGMGFLWFSLVLFLFQFFRILWITPSKPYFLLP